MSEELKGDHVAPVETSDAGTQETQTTVNDGKNTVQYDTYKRVLGKLKNTESQFQQLQDELKTLRNEKYEAEGKKDELIESLRNEVTQYKTKLSSTVGTVARSQAMNAIVEEAVKAGCSAPDVVTKYLEDQIDNLEFSEDFKPDRDQVKMLIEDAKKRAPILFSKEAPKVASHNIDTSGMSAPPQKNLKKMSLDDLMSLWSQAEGKR